LTLAQSPNLAQYDYNLIRELRGDGLGWSKIARHKQANPFDRDRRNIERWFIRESDRRNLNATVKRQTTKTITRTKKTNNKKSIPGNRYNDQKPVVLPRVYNPVRNPPTLRKSGLHIDDWIIKFCRYQWKEDYLTEMREFLLSIFYDESSKGLIFEPRKAGKTLSEIGVYAFLTLEEFKSNLVITAGTSSKNRIWRALDRIFRSDVVREFYGDVISSGSILHGEFSLIPGLQAAEDINPIMRIATRGSEIIGSHPHGATFLSDIIQEEFKSFESNESLFEWFNDVVDYLGDKVGGSATRKGLDDFYSKLFKVGFKQLRRKAIKLLKGRWPNEQDLIYETMLIGEFEEEVPVGINIDCGTFEMLPVPNWNLETILFKRTQALASFESQMQNNPIPSSGLYFRKAKHWHQIDPYPPGYLSDYYIAVDPSFGKKTGADFFCLLVGAVFENSLILVDCVLEKGLGFNEMVKEITKKAIYYNPHVTLIESTFAQTYLKDHVKSLIPNIKPFDTKRDKMQRIDSLDVPLLDRKIRIYTTLPYKATAYQQFLEYDRKPSNATKKDDFLDCLEMLYGEVKFRLTEGRYKFESW